MKISNMLSLLWLLMAASLVALAGCSVNDTTTESKGHLSVKLTDAPANYDAVYIDIQSVRIKSDNPDDNTDNNNLAADGWITINDKPVRVDLLKLRNGATIQLGEEELDAGEYHQIRLVLGSDNEVVIDGKLHALKTPGAQQSGLKLNIDASIRDDEIYNLLIDFDASRSIVAAGNDKFILKPVLHAVSLEETGSLSGSVSPNDIQTAILASANGDTLSSLTDDEGQFTIVGVTNGTYDIVFEPRNNAFVDTTITDITVDKNEDVELGTVNLPAQ